MQQLFDTSLPEDQPLNLLKLERALLIADELPGARANGSLQAGAATGTTDVLVQLSPGPAYRTDISADNGGNRTTGDERLNLQLTVFAPWGRGEQFNLAGSVSRGSTYLRVAASMPVGFGGWAGWRAGVSASALQYQVLDAMNTTTGLAPRGSSQSVGVDLQYPLVRQVNSNWVFSTGYDIRRLRNEDDNQTLNLLEVTNQSTVRTLNAGVSGSHFDQTMGGGSTTASAFYTTGQTSLDGSPQAHMNSDGLTVNTEGSFQKLRWSVARNQSLGPSFSMLASASGQWASRNLDASEKFYLGGMNGVRAYPAGEAGGSTGQLATLELRRPLGDVLGNLLGGALGSKLGGQLTVAAFYDWGQVGLYQNNQRTDGTGTLVATNNVTLQGAGLSFNWRSHMGLDVRAIWARRIGSNPLETPAGTDTDGSLTRDRLWLSAYLTF